MHSGNLDNFEEAALPHLNDLCRTATAVLGSRSEAEDVVQETYLEAWKCFHRFAPGTNCRAWLFKILFHVISHHRRRWFNRVVHQEPGTLENELVSRPSVPEHLTDEEILSAFRKIPRQFAEVVLLADVQEFSYKEIQDTLGIPIGTVMSRLSRGRQLLRTCLAGRAAADGIRGGRPRALACPATPHSAE